MKKIISGIAGFVIVFGLALSASNAQDNGQQNKQQEIAQAENIKVIYFHFSRRCATCNAVEAETEKAVKELYPKEMKNGSITFESVNLDLEEGKETGKKYGIDSQSLVVIRGSEQSDLTTEGFMNARTKPEKLKEKIRKTIEAYR
ncbi:MAG: nitrophenyl compound nitroreductase subunit ArsF family protein [Bacteroidota bacterium]|nr:nitrophenyl compound nitroreductase subunit ArsF family protein [Bacteroidota bacterium]